MLGRPWGGCCLVGCLAALGIAVLLAGCQSSPAIQRALPATTAPSPAAASTLAPNVEPTGITVSPIPPGPTPVATTTVAPVAGPTAAPTAAAPAASASLTIAHLPTAGGADNIFAPVTGHLAAMGPRDLGLCPMVARLPAWVPPPPTDANPYRVNAQIGPGGYQVTVASGAAIQFEVDGGAGAYGNSPGFEGWTVAQPNVDLGNGVRAMLYQPPPGPGAKPVVAWNDPRSGWRFRVDGTTATDAIGRARAVVSALGAPTRRESSGALAMSVPEVAGGAAGGEVDLVGDQVSLSWWPQSGCGYAVHGTLGFADILRMATTMTHLGQTPSAVGLIAPSVDLVGGTGGVVWRSADSGQTWEAVAILGDGPVQRFAAVGNGVVLARADQNVLWRSTDLGQTWSLLTVSPFGGDLVAGPWANNGLVEAEVTRAPASAGGNPTRGLIQSVDGGQTWTQAATVPATFQSPATTGGVLPPFPLGDSTWLAPVEAGSGCTLPTGFAVSRDSGKTWSGLPQPPEPWPLKRVSVAAPTVSHWFIAGQVCHGSGAPLMYETTDAGASWRGVPLKAPSDLDLGALAFVNAKEGAAVGAIGAGPGAGQAWGHAGVLTTVDGGASWTVQSPPGVAGLFDLSCSDNGRCLALSTGSTALVNIQFARP